MSTIDEETKDFCKVCGAWMEWQDCFRCGGDGFIDETEFDPLEGDEDALCVDCNGEGGWLECSQLPHSPAVIAEYEQRHPALKGKA